MARTRKGQTHPEAAHAQAVEPAVVGDVATEPHPSVSAGAAEPAPTVRAKRPRTNKAAPRRDPEPRRPQGRSLADQPPRGTAESV